MIRIVHTADWQLGKPFGRFPDDARTALMEARLDVIDTIGQVAEEHRATHVVVAGDVFDNIDPGDRIVVQAMSRMGRAATTWWLMPGNHDHARAGGLWSRVRGKAPANVRVVDRFEAVELEEGAWLLPAPLDHRRTRDDPTSYFADMATPPGAIRIGLAHGSITEFGGSSEATNIIPPDRARTANLDYLALGDWHGHLLVNDRTAYSGTPETDRFGRDEPGSVIVAEISAMALPRIDRVETGRFRWLSREWQVADLADFSRAAEALRTEVDLSRTLLDLSLTGAVSLADRVAIHAALADDVSHALRWLGYDTDTLVVRPTADDLANIDIQGTLAKAAERLQLQVTAGGADAALASAALERLYIEALRLRDEQPA
ncbi:MAG: exonuclease SbcCD subunit D [Sphingobium sp.]